jgi:hypothetical protein
MLAESMVSVRLEAVRRRDFRTLFSAERLYLTVPARTRADVTDIGIDQSVLAERVGVDRKPIVRIETEGEPCSY